MKDHGFRVHGSTSSFMVIQGEEQGKERRPRPKADPPGILTFKGSSWREDPARKEPSEETEASGHLDATCGGNRRVTVLPVGSSSPVLSVQQQGC